MAEIMHLEIEFDAEGNLVDPAAEHALRDAIGDGRTNVLVFAHGWNNTPEKARILFQRFFTTVENSVSDARKGALTTVGVIWPAIRWPDEPDPARSAGGAASVSTNAAADTNAALAEGLKAVFPSPAEHRALDRLLELLDVRPHEPAALREFQGLLGELAAGPDAADADEDRAEEPILVDNPENVFASFADLSPGQDSGGAAGFGDVWKRTWNGAREAMRVATYYQMKKRAGVVGKQGLGPLLGRLPAELHARVHTIGHSFGARVVSFALAGLPDQATGAVSPVKSMFLVQGAFSHYSFATTLPFQKEGGALAGMQARVDGPIVVTYTAKDLALADFYPRASLLRGQDASAQNRLLQRWAAMGWDGAQEVDATARNVGPVGTSYDFRRGGFLNLDCNALIQDGPWPFGSHSDIIHDELGWVVAAASGLERN
jgi:hypothetical protein